MEKCLELNNRVCHNKNMMKTINNDTVTKQKITETVFKIIDEVNELLPQDARIDKSLETSLVGQSSVLDSMGIVFLIVATEKKLKEEFAVEVKLTNDYNIFRKDNPLQTIGTFTDYISGILAKESAR